MPVTTARARLSGFLNGFTDAQLTAWLSAAQVSCERYCFRSFDRATFVETYDGNGDTILYLRQMPLVSVGSVVIRYFDDSTISFDSTNFNLDLRLAAIQFTRTALQSSGSCGNGFVRGMANITATYDAGFVTLPDDLQEAIVEVASFIAAANGADPSVKSEKLGDYAITRMSGLEEDALPKLACRLLAPYRRFRV